MATQLDVSGSGNYLSRNRSKLDSETKIPDSVRDDFEKIQREKDYFTSVIRNFRNGMLTTDNDLNVVFCNLTVERLLGYTLDELRAMKLSDLIRSQEVSVQKILEQGGMCVDPRTGEMGEFSFITKTGSVFPVEACFSVITDTAGDTCGMSCTFRDVTRKKQMERILARMDRLSSLGELASGMAHEIKNPLACIAGVLQNMPCPAGNESCAEMVPEIMLQVKRIDTIINSLLHFAKPGPAEMEPLQISAIVKSTVDLVEHHLVDKQITLKLELDECDPLVRGDEHLLQQVLLNLLMNASEALSEVEYERVLAVTLHCCEHANPETGDPQADLFRYVEIRIDDNGPGIDKEFLDSIFNPFFTTKHAGTGLGLPTSHRIMEEHNGDITVSSEPGVGSTFKLSLPVYSPA